MLRKFRIKGLCAAPVTPFKKNGDINTDFTKQYVQHFLDYGVPNAFVTGTTGEGNNLTAEERKAVAQSWVTQAKHKLSSVVVHIGANNLRDSQHLAEHAQSIGVDAIACVGTAFYKPQTINDYMNYMSEVAAAAPDLPFMLYDIDFVTGIKFDVNTFFSLAKEKIPNLFGVKHTSPNFVSMNNTMEDHKDIQLFIGSNEMYLQALAIGIEEPIMNSYSGNVLNRLREAYYRGDMETARNEQKRMLAVGKLITKYGLSIAGGNKAIMNVMGFDVGQPRLPLSPVSDDTLKALKKDLEDIGFFKWSQKQ